MVRYHALSMIVAVMVLAACGLASQSPPAPPDVTLAIGLVDNTVAQESQDVDRTASGQPIEGRVVLKSASVTLTVEDASGAINQITQLAEELGGWIVSSNTSKVTRSNGEFIQGTITIRVPAALFNDALARMKATASAVESETITGQDVTQEYTDLTSQLSNLRAAEAQLQSIMENARTTDDVLNVYNELVRVRGEIETAQGRIRYYEESAAFSSISATLIPPVVEQPIQIAGWSPGRTAETALATLVNVLRGLADVLITLVILVLPLVLIFVIPGWLIARLLTRRGIIRLSSPGSSNPSSPE